MSLQTSNAGSTGHVRSPASFKTQAKALFRKNASYQARNRATNIRIFAIPIGFCVLLAILQSVINSALNSDNNKCGCKCLYCCDDRTGTDVCRRATDSDPCIPGQFSSCKEKDESQCGLTFSNSQQAVFCPITNPISWPAFLQVPEEPYRAEPYRPAAALLYTGQNQSVAEGLVGFLVEAPNLSNAAAFQEAADYLSPSQGSLGQGLRVGEAFAVLGLTAGTPSTEILNTYVESAFVNATAMYNMVSSCQNDSSTASLNTFVNANSGGSQFFSRPFNCTTAQPVWNPTAAEIERSLFCGFKQSRCSNSSQYLDIEGLSQAWDFGATSRDRLSLRMWFNDSNVLSGGQSPPPYLRVNKGLNMATNAFLKWALGSNYSATLNGVVEMPKPGSKLTLDFSSLLGPLFFCWLLELLLPVMVVQLVTEKERRLRIMMKMHGLGDGPYWLVMYAWFVLLYLVYMLVFVAFGSAINLKFFRLTDYAFTIVFFAIWGFTLVSSAFLASVFFTNPKTALVTTYLYVFATGLLGSLLLGTYMGLDEWWVNICEIVPAFSLYRGLYIMGNYAFIAAYSGSGGLSFSEFNSDGNGLAVVFIILLVEAVLFLGLAWFLEQVLPSGTGVRRHPLFFLPEKWQLARKRREQAAVTALGRRVSLEKPPGGRASQVIEASSIRQQSLDEKPQVPSEGADVAAERSRVDRLIDLQQEAIVMHDLSKVYPAQDGNPPKLAVRGLSLGVGRGECFGLLGPNGAGKSSAIHMLVGLQEPTSGTAFVGGLSIKDDMHLIYSRMGVCPQHDLIWDMLTPREHLLFYGRLKNLEGAELEAQVESGLKSVNLWSSGVADKRVGQFSGGMKRRLSVAISLIGRPEAVYMDEPSTGLDPASRRNLWDVVKRAKAGRGIILTTHSMEEAEVLCDRLGIFVDGQLVCIGGPKELTARFGGYLVFTITTPPGPDMVAADALARRMSPNAVQTYSLAGTQRYELPTSEVSIGSVFSTVELAKSQFAILDWGISSATLEEVFIKLARSLGVEGGA